MRFTTILASVRVLSTVLAASLQQPIPADEPATQPVLHDEKHHKHHKHHDDTKFTMPDSLEPMMNALGVMQEKYFNLVAGRWPTAIDWTAAVIGTHVSATLSSLVTGLGDMKIKGKKKKAQKACTSLLAYENLINIHFAQTSIFYYMENALSLRGQAYDDMLWVVLGWLENVKFAEMYNNQHIVTKAISEASWHGIQMTPLAAHRARVFYELAETGWDTKACGGGMVWNPRLVPYKNAITNELFIAASITMYLYFPGDNNTAPFMTANNLPQAHDPKYLANAVRGYSWLRESNMTNNLGLFQDGYHIKGWKKYKNGTINPGTSKCDSLNKMVYTYNQGVILGASRGLWLATGLSGYLSDGHRLVENVIKATGWPAKDRYWKGLGRGGVLEESCDRGCKCSQDGQTFKGIFFHNLVEFCRPLWPSEEKFLLTGKTLAKYYEPIYKQHMARCALYADWIEHNAAAAEMTQTESGLFGSWWGVPTHAPESDEILAEGEQELEEGADDWRNPASSVAGLDFTAADVNDRGRGRTVETQSGGLAVLRARWQWHSVFGKDKNHKKKHHGKKDKKKKHGKKDKKKHDD